MREAWHSILSERWRSHVRLRYVRHWADWSMDEGRGMCRTRFKFKNGQNKKKLGLRVHLCVLNIIIYKNIFTKLSPVISFQGVDAAARDWVRHGGCLRPALSLRHGDQRGLHRWQRVWRHLQRHDPGLLHHSGQVGQQKLAGQSLHLQSDILADRHADVRYGDKIMRSRGSDNWRPRHL